MTRLRRAWAQFSGTSGGVGSFPVLLPEGFPQELSSQDRRSFGMRRDLRPCRQDRAMGFHKRPAAVPRSARQNAWAAARVYRVPEYDLLRQRAQRRRARQLQQGAVSWAVAFPGWRVANAAPWKRFRIARNRLRTSNVATGEPAFLSRVITATAALRHSAAH